MSESLTLWTDDPDAGGSQLMDLTRLARPFPLYSINEHGPARCEFRLLMARRNLNHFRRYLTGKYVIVAKRGIRKWGGRVKDVLTSDNNEIEVVAYGPWSYLTETDSTRDIWSTIKIDRWEQPVTGKPNDTYSNDKFTLEKEGSRMRLYPKKGAGFDDVDIGAMMYTDPIGIKRKDKYFTFNYVAKGGAYGSWRTTILLWSRDWVYEGNRAGYLSSTPGAGGTISGSVNVNLATPSDRIFIIWYRNIAAKTLTAGVVAAGYGTVPVTSMAGIVKGRAVAIGGANPEVVEVEATTASTFSATFRNLHSVGDSVKIVHKDEPEDCYIEIDGMRVRYASSVAIKPNEIIPHLVSEYVNPLNPASIGTQYPWIQIPDFDLQNFEYFGMTPAAIIDYLANLGDKTNGPWVGSVREDRRVQFRPKDYSEELDRIWYVRGIPEVASSSNDVITRVEPSYFANDATQYATVQAATITEEVLGRAVQRTIDYPSGRVLDATALAREEVHDNRILKDFGEITTDRVFRAYQPNDVDEVKPHDVVVLRDFTGFADETQQIQQRTFRVSEVEVVMAPRPIVTIIPEQPTPTVARELAQLATMEV